MICPLLSEATESLRVPNKPRDMVGKTKRWCSGGVGHTILSASADPSEDVSRDARWELQATAVVDFDPEAFNNVTMCSITRARCIMMLQSHIASWLFSDNVASRR